MAAVQVNGALRPLAHEKSGALTSATGFTAAKYVLDLTTNDPLSRRRHAEEVFVTIETAAVRWTCDGTDPTATAGTALGHVASAGDSITLSGYDAIRKFRAINEVDANGATFRATFFFA